HTCQTPTITPSVISSENINPAEPHAENDEVADDEFINIFSTPVQDQGETSSRHVDSSNMHTFYQRYPSEQRWTKDHPLEQVIGNPSQSVRTRRLSKEDFKLKLECAVKVPLFFWAEAIATACFTQNRSLVIPRHEKTPYHIIKNQKPSVKFFHIFGSTCYIVRDGENLDKIKEKGDDCIFVGCSTQSRAYRVFNKRTRVIMESIHVNFDELPHMASDQLNSDPAPECQTMALNHDSLSPAIQRQENVPQADRTVTTSKELDLIFSPMFDELLNGSSKVLSKSFAVSVADALNQRQQYTTPLNIHTTPAPTCQVSTLAPTVSSSENINQAEKYAENDQVADDEFINIFSTPVQDQGETSSRHVDSSNMHTFYQRYPSEHRWTKDHPLEQVIGNPSQSVRTRRQLESDVEMCMFALSVSRTEPKNIKEAMADSAWIESMQEELHQFDRLDV
nr:retrovirus-related Pol polyprotein from transposon TNT 1-94 [Tanacetum cinerariifolium]